MELIIGNPNDIHDPLDGYVENATRGKIKVWTKTFKNTREHIWSTDTPEGLFVIFGNIYGMEGCNIELKIANIYQSAGVDGVFNIDGDFIFFIIKDENNIIALQSNYGGANLYYRKFSDRYVFSTEASILFDGFNACDIDERSVCDYLLYGSLIGGNTFSKKVKAIVRGQELDIVDGREIIRTEKIIRFDSNYKDIGIDRAADHLVEAYLTAVKKRVNKRIDTSTMFLSGGKDSRLLLAAFSKLYGNKMNCISFGHIGSDEVSTASEVAALKGNHHDIINLKPVDFISNAEEYIKVSAGMDWFPQGYVLSVLKHNFPYTDIYAGSFLTDIVFHSKYSKGDMGTFEGTLCEYFNKEENLGFARMKRFSIEELSMIFHEGKRVESHLEEDTTRYSGAVGDVFLGYMNNTNGANQISFRTDVFPNKYMDTFDPSMDKDFVKEMCHLPLEYRCSDEIHVKMIERIEPDYLIPIYSDYRLPMKSSKQDKSRALYLEAEREKLFRNYMSQYNHASEQKIYYVHDYADFEGYITYDPDWIDYMDRLLMNNDAFIYQLYFDNRKVQNMIEEHRSGKRSWQKQLILLASLEQFFQIYLK